MLIADLFKDKALGEKLRNDGYVVLDLLSSEDVNELQSIFDKSESQVGVDKQFYTSIWSENKDYRREIDQQLKRILFPCIARYINDAKPVFTNFHVKTPGEKSSLVPHQDWSFAEEPEFDSVTVWCPLVDVDSVNGNLQVIPQTHTLKNYVRPRFANRPFDEIGDAELQKQFLDVPLKAGQTIVINSRLIHASPPNNSKATRVAASVVLVPQQATLYHWVLQQDDGGMILKKLAITPDFFWEYSCYDHLKNLEPQQAGVYHPYKLTAAERLMLQPSAQHGPIRRAISALGKLLSK